MCIYKHNNIWLLVIICTYFWISNYDIAQWSSELNRKSLSDYQAMELIAGIEDIYKSPSFGAHIVAAQSWDMNGYDINIRYLWHIHERWWNMNGYQPESFVLDLLTLSEDLSLYRFHPKLLHFSACSGSYPTPWQVLWMQKTAERQYMLYEFTWWQDLTWS